MLNPERSNDQNDQTNNSPESYGDDRVKFVPVEGRSGVWDIVFADGHDPATDPAVIDRIVKNAANELGKVILTQAIAELRAQSNPDSSSDDRTLS